MENLFTPESRAPGRSVLIATAITLVTLPMLVLYNVSYAPETGTQEVATAAPENQISDAQLVASDGEGAATEVDQAVVETTSTTVVVTTRAAEDLSAAAPTTTVAAPTTTTVAPTTTTAAPTTTTVAPTTTTAHPTTTTAAPTTTTAAPTTTTTAPATTTTAQTSGNGMWVTVDGKKVPSPNLFNQLAACESGGNWAINTGNGFYGGLQFAQRSWSAVGGQGRPDQATAGEQIYRGQKLWSLQGWGAWPSCTRQLGWR